MRYLIAVIALLVMPLVYWENFYVSSHFDGRGGVIGSIPAPLRNAEKRAIRAAPIHRGEVWVAEKEAVARDNIRRKTITIYPKKKVEIDWFDLRFRKVYFFTGDGYVMDEDNFLSKFKLVKKSRFPYPYGERKE